MMILEKYIKKVCLKFKYVDVCYLKLGLIILCKMFYMFIDLELYFKKVWFFKYDLDIFRKYCNFLINYCYLRK